MRAARRNFVGLNEGGRPLDSRVPDPHPPPLPPIRAAFPPRKKRSSVQAARASAHRGWVSAVGAGPAAELQAGTEELPGVVKLSPSPASRLGALLRIRPFVNS